MNKSLKTDFTLLRNKLVTPEEIHALGRIEEFVAGMAYAFELAHPVQSCLRPTKRKRSRK